MEIQSDETQGVTVLRPVGRLDAAGAKEIQDVFAKHLNDGVRWIAFDFSDTENLSGAVIRVLLATATKLATPEGGFVLCGMNTHVRRGLEVSGLSRKFVSKDTRSEAVSHLTGEIGVKNLAEHAAVLLAEAAKRDEAKEGNVS